MKKAEAIRRALDLEDTLSDLMIGYRLWRDRKVGSGGWDEHDEALDRWIMGGPHREALDA